MSEQTKTETVDLGVKKERIFKGPYPKATVRQALQTRFNGPDAPSHFSDITFKGDKFLVQIPADLDDDDYTNHLADFEGIVYGELMDLLDDGGIEDYMTDEQRDRL